MDNVFSLKILGRRYLLSNRSLGESDWGDLHGETVALRPSLHQCLLNPLYSKSTHAGVLKVKPGYNRAGASVLRGVLLFRCPEHPQWEFVLFWTALVPTATPFTRCTIHLLREATGGSSTNTAEGDPQIIACDSGSMGLGEEFPLNPRLLQISSYPLQSSPYSSTVQSFLGPLSHAQQGNMKLPLFLSWQCPFKN